MNRKKIKLTKAQKECRVVDPNLPFSLECSSCDAGQEISTPEAALLAGWAHISPCDTPVANYIGDCPDCQIEEVKQEIDDRKAYWARTLKAKGGA